MGNVHESKKLRKTITKERQKSPRNKIILTQSQINQGNGKQVWPSLFLLSYVLSFFKFYQFKSYMCLTPPPPTSATFTQAALILYLDSSTSFPPALSLSAPAPIRANGFSTLLAGARVSVLKHKFDSHHLYPTCIPQKPLNGFLAV